MSGFRHTVHPDGGPFKEGPVGQVVFDRVVVYDAAAGGEGNVVVVDAALPSVGVTGDEWHRISTIVGEVAGYVSVCWEPRPEGVFDSTKAAAAVDTALTAIRSIINKEI